MKLSLSQPIYLSHICPIHETRENLNEEWEKKIETRKKRDQTEIASFTAETKQSTAPTKQQVGGKRGGEREKKRKSVCWLVFALIERKALTPVKFLNRLSLRDFKYCVCRGERVGSADLPSLPGLPPGFVFGALEPPGAALSGGLADISFFPCF